MPSTHDERPEPSFWNEYMAEWRHLFRRTSERDRVSWASFLATVATAGTLTMLLYYTPLHSLHGFVWFVAWVAVWMLVYWFLLVLFRRIDRRLRRHQHERSGA